MKALFLSILLIAIATAAFAKGGSGYYTITCTMRNKATHKPIRNAVFVINGDTVKTNARGVFSYEMKWVSVCRSLLTKEEVRVRNNARNPALIPVKYSGGETTIENKWRTYAGRKKAYRVTVYW